MQQGVTDQATLLNKQCYILLKLIELKKAFGEAAEIKKKLDFVAGQGSKLKIVNKNSDIN